MDVAMILEGLKYIAIIALGGLSIYFKTSTKAKTKAREVQETIAEIAANVVIYIKEAEEAAIETTTPGYEKFESVVSKLYAMVPEALRGIITREMVENMVQSTFDEIKAYMAAKLDEKISDEEVK